jgi:hypothetical protein
MIRQETYEWISDEFGISVGIAKILGYKKLRDEKEELSPIVYKTYNEELTINEIITDSIDEAKYQPLQREIYRLRSKGTKVKDLTLYKKAWRDINERNQ